MMIGGREVGPSHKPFVVAEVAQTHDGSLGNALAFIDIAKECGADAIKFQTHIAAEESTPSEPWRVRFSRQDETRYDYWQRMGFTKEQWRALKEHADKAGLIFLSSPFSIMACEWLEEIGVPAWKVASGEVHNLPLIEWIAGTGKPIILSSGLSTVDETTSLARSLIEQGHDVAVLHCTTRYPTPAEEVGLNLLAPLAATGAVIGLSDHSGTIFPSVVAAYLGASLIEVHLTMHRKMFGPDVSSSLTPEELRSLVSGVEFAWRMRSHNVVKEEQLGTLLKERSIFGRSLVARRSIRAGEAIAESDLAYKKPGGGLRYEQRDALVGKRARAQIAKDQILGMDDVE